jgi:hypothetical protein
MNNVPKTRLFSVILIFSLVRLPIPLAAPQEHPQCRGRPLHLPNGRDVWSRASALLLLPPLWPLPAVGCASRTQPGSHQSFPATVMNMLWATYCYAQHAVWTCYMSMLWKHAMSNMLWATCYEQHAMSNMLWTTCYEQHAMSNNCYE